MLYWEWWQPSLIFGCMRRYQRHQFAQRTRTADPVVGLPLTRSLGRQIQSQISLSHAKIVAVICLFGIQRHLSKPLRTQI